MLKKDKQETRSEIALIKNADFTIDGQKVTTIGHIIEDVISIDNPFDAADIQKRPRYRIDSRFLKEMIKRTLVITEMMDFFNPLCCLLFEFGENGITCVTTDGKRLIFQEKKAVRFGETFIDAVKITPYTAQLLSQTLPDDDKKTMVEISVNKRRMILQFNQTAISVNTLPGEYPKWRNVVQDVPKTPNIKIEKDLLTHSFLVMKGRQILETRLTFEKDRLIISNRSDKNGVVKITIPIKYSGQRMEKAVDERLFLDYLVHTAGEKILLYPGLPRSDKDYYPLMLKTAKEEFGIVIMPLGID